MEDDATLAAEGWEVAPAPTAAAPAPAPAPRPAADVGGGPRPFFKPVAPVTVAKETGKTLAGILLEPAGAMLSGLASSTAGGAMGTARALGGLFMGEDFDTAVNRGADLVRSTQEKFTYEPRTQIGQYATTMLGAPFTLASRGLEAGGGAVGAMVGPTTEAVMSTVGAAAPEAFGAYKGARGLAAMRPTAQPLTQQQRALGAMQQAGYYVPPAKANPTLINQLMESLSGEYIEPKLALKNQPITNEKTRSALGLPRDIDLSEGTFNAYRGQQYAAYDALKRYQYGIRPDATFLSEIKNLDSSFRAVKNDFPGLARSGEVDRLSAQLQTPSNPAMPGQFSAAGLVDMTKQLRSEANAIYRKDRTGQATPDEIALAGAKRRAAASIEGLVERELNNMGQTRLLDSFRDARRSLAMLDDVEAATNTTTGNVDAQVLRRLLDKGRPLSGELREIAEAARTMPSVMKRTEGITPSMGLSTSDIGQAGILAKLAKGGKYAALALVRPAASAISTSRPFQMMSGQPQPAQRMGPVRPELLAPAAGAEASRYRMWDIGEPAQ